MISMTLRTLKLNYEIQRGTRDMAHAHSTYPQFTDKNISLKNIQVGR